MTSSVKKGCATEAVKRTKKRKSELKSIRMFWWPRTPGSVGSKIATLGLLPQISLARLLMASSDPSGLQAVRMKCRKL